MKILKGKCDSCGTYKYIIPDSKFGELLRDNTAFICPACESAIDLTKGKWVNEMDQYNGLGVENYNFKDDDNVLCFRCKKCNNFYIMNLPELDSILEKNESSVNCYFCKFKNPLTSGKWRLFKDVRKEYETISAERLTEKTVIKRNN